MSNSLDFENEITCPKCNTVYTHDSWEKDDEGEEWCEECGCHFRYERNIEITYSMEEIEEDEE